MSIKDIGKKIKLYLETRLKPLFLSLKAVLEIKEDLFIILAIILIGLAGFGLGKISALEKNRGDIDIKKLDLVPMASSTINQSKNLINITDNIPMSASAMIASESAKGLLVASKNGQKYHFPWCAGASQIADKNKIWFSSYEEAQKAGYTAATNCKNLK
jgi:hypothetical protein